MRHYIFIVIVLFAVSASAQGFGEVLTSIEQNNLQLQAARKANAAAMSEAKAENSLGETSVEYSPFYAGGVSGIASSELIVSQEFDFPTTYALRSRLNASQQRLLDLQYQTLRRDVLLEAEKQCIEVCFLSQKHVQLERLIEVADTLAGVYKKRMQNGDATQIDVNRILVEQMNLRADLLQNESESTACMLRLQRMNGGIPVDTLLRGAKLPDFSIFNPSDLSAASLENSLGKAMVQQADREVAAANQGWLPKLTLGYRRNTDLNVASNGFLIGANIPIFSTSAKAKAARQRRVAAELEAHDVAVGVQSDFAALVSEAEQVQKMLQAYDSDLMQQTLSLLHRAVMAGELSVSDYYSEVSVIVGKQKEMLDLKSRLFMLRADLNRNSL